MSTQNETYVQFAADFTNTLHPEGPLEKTFANEIAGAAWRLQNCRVREAASELTDAEQLAVNRIRAQAQTAMRRCLAELRRLQTERQLSAALLPEGADSSHFGLASIKDIMKVRKFVPEPELGLNCKNALERDPHSQPALASFCKSPIPFPVPARIRPCPCRSGLKYKKCCGRNGPPAAGQAA